MATEGKRYLNETMVMKAKEKDDSQPLIMEVFGSSTGPSDQHPNDHDHEIWSNKDGLLGGSHIHQQENFQTVEAKSHPSLEKMAPEV